MAPAAKETLRSEVKKSVCPAGKTMFSIIIDESTNVTCTKVLACAVMFVDTDVQTKYLFSIDLDGEKAKDLFQALDMGLQEFGFSMENIIGFTADTTNVMFVCLPLSSTRFNLCL
ncbi:uncharacterized protein LOC117193069 [Drosophila miranda]|uniref:uncharacterized protein LOC117193069 n=1 Tax=Drosophila miranda TaxID=7229 RepID=UPI00143F4FF6|nr:uncharacterized protein LOC117193069 [Drosophila miranda]